MPTIREIIKEKSESLRKVDLLGPHKAAEELVELSSLMATLNAEIVEKQFAYNTIRQQFLLQSKSVAEAKVAAEASQAWLEWQERVQWREALKELIRAVKYYLREAEQEFKEFIK